MTSQLLMSNRSATISRNESSATSTQTLTKQGLSTISARSQESVKLIYQADQQVKFLHLQAEVETLLLELQTLKQHRHSTLIEDATLDRN
ncbi:hypothetical protein BCD67_09325 [Oscillatoriales cyanobacterium USR001]|nr:hypothetical protein BCD67_09325 [Oscillatoriales cyanobacterium USR001]